MPMYSFINKESGEETTHFMSMSELDEYLVSNPHLSQTLCAPPIISGVPKKPDDGFRDLLKNMHKSNSKGFKRSTINTF